MPEKQVAEPITKLIFNELDAHNASHDKQIKNYAEPFSGMMRVGLEVINKINSAPPLPIKTPNPPNP